MSKSSAKRIEVASKRLKEIEKLVEPYTEDVSLKRAPARRKWVPADHLEACLEEDADEREFARSWHIS